PPSSAVFSAPAEPHPTRHRKAMKRTIAGLSVLLLISAIPARSQQEETYDYWAPQRELIRYGQQAIFMCNGLFTSNRTLEQIFAQELAFLPEPVGTPEGGAYVIDRERRAVSVGIGGTVPAVHAAYREGVGC